jgi:hypothetical protein
VFLKIAVYSVTLVSLFSAGFLEMRIWREMEAYLDWNTEGLEVVPRALRNVAKEYKRRNPEDSATIRKYKHLVAVRTLFLFALVIEVFVLLSEALYQ